MNLDGEWRVAFIADEHPGLEYGTAPMPVDNAHPELYGSGYINGTIVGIPKGVKHKAQAWDLVKYLTTDNHALAVLSNGLRNVPTTRASLTSKEIKPDVHFATFLKIFGNPKSSTSPITARRSRRAASRSHRPSRSRQRKVPSARPSKSARTDSAGARWKARGW